MELVNNKEGIPFEHYCAQWKNLDPQEAAVRCAIGFDGAAFTVHLYGVCYRLAWPVFSVTADVFDAFALDNIPAQILMMRYVMMGKRAEPLGKFMTYREMPWGTVYLTPFTGRCLTRGAFTFGTRLQAFCVAMEKQGATALSHGDAGYELAALENFSLQVLVWAGDEEFPPSCQILFSDNCAQVFSAEDLAVLCDVLISNTKKLMT